MTAHMHKCPECQMTVECYDKKCAIIKDSEISYSRFGEEQVCPQCKKFPLIDLRPITRGPDKYETVVRIFHHDRSLHRSKKWIIMGQASLVKNDRNSMLGIRIWTLKAYLSNGTTDCEHDSAFAINMALLAVDFNSVFYGHTELNAIIDPHDVSSFHVPSPGYNPMEHPAAVECTIERCIEADGPHIIVPNYVPPVNEKLFQLARGRFVQIMFGVPSER